VPQTNDYDGPETALSCRRRGGTARVQDAHVAKRADDLVAEQLRYYRARASEYDATSYGAVSAEMASVSAIVDRLGISGDVLELACGTGIWTAELIRHASTLTALDGSPEMLGLARRRVPTSVRFDQVDLFNWMPTSTWDVVFFSAWLSHVPSGRFADFWSRVAAAVRPGGRAIALDELPARSRHEEHVQDEVAVRTLQDGTTHEIVKVFWEPDALVKRLAALGWQATVTPIEHDWFILDATHS
jgi:demethylmenaquinone methyltransferase/2-methoxy-6-polyprenyl-1,4-benzoquinol methylase